MTQLNQHINRPNGNAKTVCVSRVLGFFGISPEKYKNTYNARTGKNVWEGILRRNGFAVRSRKSSLPSTVGATRLKLSKLDDPKGTLYVVGVDKHILLLDSTGETIVDTDPRKRDRRVIKKVYAVYPK